VDLSGLYSTVLTVLMYCTALLHSGTFSTSTTVMYPARGRGTADCTSTIRIQYSSIAVQYSTVAYSRAYLRYLEVGPTCTSYVTTVRVHSVRSLHVGARARAS